MCGSSTTSPNGITGWPAGEPQPGYTPIQGAPLTYQNGQWVQNGSPVNPAGGVTPSIGGWPASMASGNPPPATPAQPSAAPGINPMTAMAGMAKGMTMPTNISAPAAQAGAQGSMPMTGGGQPITNTNAQNQGGGGSNPGMAMLIRALLAKGV